MTQGLHVIGQAETSSAQEKHRSCSWHGSPSPCRRCRRITLTHYADEESFRAMKLSEEGDDFEYRKLVNAEFAKVMVAHGFQLKVQVLDAKEYFEWLGVRQNTYQAQQEYPGGQHVSGDQALTLLGIK